MRRLGLLLGAVSISAPSVAVAFCPSYTVSSSANSHDCGIEAVNGRNPTPAEWQELFAVAAAGPTAWGANGPALEEIGQGCGNPEPLHRVPARFPCELLKALAMQESSWRQFCVPDRPVDQAGGAERTIISFDCGYGVGQVTSGMHKGEAPGFDRVRVAGDPLYNLATGASILAGKWRLTECVGDNQPSVIENWYAATWAYNGLSYKNNPNNPNYDSNRGVWNPQAGGGAPYQEKVLGWIEHPPSASHWASVAVGYPRLSDVGGANGAPELPEPTCASPTDCTATRARNVSVCFKSGTPDAGGSPGPGPGPGDAGSTDHVGSDPGPEDPAITDGGSPDSAPADAEGCGCGGSGGA
ncbi:MAG: hypothetical protein WBV82_08560, partial [Myxococcaceae bacterium]